MMAIGMTYDQYWHGDVRMVGAFLKAEEIRKKQKDREMWLQGMYVYDAIGRLAPSFKFGVKKPTPIPYMDHPYMFKEEDNIKETEAEKEQKAENERIKAIWFFRRWAKDTSKQFQK